MHAHSDSDIGTSPDFYSSDGLAVCLGCGCTDLHACDDDGVPCSWAAVNRERGIGICSRCQRLAEAHRRQEGAPHAEGEHGSGDYEAQPEAAG